MDPLRQIILYKGHSYGAHAFSPILSSKPDSRYLGPTALVRDLSSVLFSEQFMIKSLHDLPSKAVKINYLN